MIYNFGTTFNKCRGVFAYQINLNRHQANYSLITRVGYKCNNKDIVIDSQPNHGSVLCFRGENSICRINKASGRDNNNEDEDNDSIGNSNTENEGNVVNVDTDDVLNIDTL